MKHELGRKLRTSYQSPGKASKIEHIRYLLEASPAAGKPFRKICFSGPNALY